MKTIKEKAVDLLQKCDTLVLASIDTEGCPRPVPIAKIATESISTIWMSTGTSSQKTKEFSINPKAGLSFYADGNSVVLTGEVEVVEDMESKERYWQNWFINHFPQGVKDPEYILLKFQSHHATIYIDNQFERVTIEE